MNRFCTLEEIADTVCFLASDRAAMITGLMFRGRRLDSAVILLKGVFETLLNFVAVTLAI
jgi:NAD(P)-dependent dehydrogenase (short-subunit alcohol dehydrogenase family)